MKRLKHPNDVRRFLASVIRRVEAGEMEPSLGGRIGYLCNVLVKVMEVSHQQGRLEDLVRRLDEMED